MNLRIAQTKVVERHCFKNKIKTGEPGALIK
jgi:hypothetical protein